jgi:hypothetical protein
MLCLTCSTEPHPGATTYAVGQAVAICQACGAGVCERHLARRHGESACLCPSCAAAGGARIANRDHQEIHHVAS